MYLTVVSFVIMPDTASLHMHLHTYTCTCMYMDVFQLITLCNNRFIMKTMIIIDK